MASLDNITKTILATRDNPKNIRNICILAHVDHGKTTLSDRLISANRIISPKLAGKIRWMDDMKQEQEKGITMKSSSISLLHNHSFKRQFFARNKPKEDFLINLIDSPGHIDFSGEVSTAVRLCDGAIVVVDVLEGVCIQTQAVLRQAWNEKVQPCLVLNKIDRLFVELHMTPFEAYLKLTEVLEQVNAVTGNLWQELMNEKMEQKEEAANKDLEDWNIEDEDDSQLYFAPERGNVVFASAIDGWGFRIHQFAIMHSKRLGMNRRNLTKVLWGEHYLNMKKKVIYKEDKTGRGNPMFVTWILKNIWDIYTAGFDKNQKVLAKVAKQLRLKVTPRELDVKRNKPEQLVSAILSKWLPLSKAVLGMVVEGIPSPLRAQKLGVPLLWDLALSQEIDVTDEEKIRYDRMVSGVMKCRSDSDVVIYVSKVFAKDRSAGAKIITSDSVTTNVASSEQADTSEEGEEQTDGKKEVKTVAASDPDSSRVFIGFSRIFSGTIRIDQKVQVLGPRYDPRDPSKHRREVIVKELYMLMGKEMVPVDYVPAGNVFGIGGVDGIILKSATVATNPLCSSFASMTFGFAPIVQVAVEPSHPRDMNKLVEGLSLLNQADPCVEIVARSTGDFVIKASGELHLERCLHDLKETFAAVEIEVSDPIVPFKETITSALANEIESATIEVFTPDKHCSMKLKAYPLPTAVTEFLQNSENRDMLRKIFEMDLAKKLVDLTGEEADQERKLYSTFRDTLLELLRDASTGNANEYSAEESLHWETEFYHHLWAFGPETTSSNILLNHIDGFWVSPQWKSLGRKVLTKEEVDNYQAPKNYYGDPTTEEEEPTEDELQAIQDAITKLLANENGFIRGFQMAAIAGPLMAEPMTGVAFVVEEFKFHDDTAIVSKRGTLEGQMISAVKEGCKSAFMAHSVRIVEPMYLCDLLVTNDGLRNAHVVLNKRRAKIVEEYPKAGTDSFYIQSSLPVAESFGFCTEMRTTTSGKADAQLQFSHWQVLDEDPFFVPTTEEEKEEFGDVIGQNAPVPLSKRMITEVRKRKGMHVEEKTTDGEKNRNLSRKK